MGLACRGSRKLVWIEGGLSLPQTVKFLSAPGVGFSGVNDKQAVRFAQCLDEARQVVGKPVMLAEIINTGKSGIGSQARQMQVLTHSVPKE